MSPRCVAGALALLLGGCRPDPGAPQYPAREPWDPTTDDPDFVPGEDPYEEGEERLSIGIFYEGGASEVLPIDDETRHWYIYEGTFSQGLSEDRAEGLVSDEITLTGAQPWWGGGVTWDTPTDLSAWTTLHISFASRDPSFASFDIGMGDGVAEARVSAAEVGFRNGGAWTSLTIPLSAFSGVDLTRVTLPLLLASGSGAAGDRLRVDALYFTKE
jgi:hypothetical protein